MVSMSCGQMWLTCPQSDGVFKTMECNGSLKPWAVNHGMNKLAFGGHRVRF